MWPSGLFSPLFLHFHSLHGTEVACEHAAEEKSKQKRRGWKGSVVFFTCMLESCEAIVAVSLYLWYFAMTLWNQPSRDRKWPCAAQNYSQEAIHANRQTVTWKGCFSAIITWHMFIYVSSLHKKLFEKMTVPSRKAFQMVSERHVEKITTISEKAT